MTRSRGTSNPSISGMKKKGSQFASLEDQDKMDMDRGALNEGETSRNGIWLGATEDDQNGKGKWTETLTPN